LVFGLSPNKENLYNSAIKELEILRSLDVIALRNYVDQSVSSELKNFDFKKVMLKANSLSTLHVSPRIDWSPASILPFVFERVPMTGSIVEIERYFLTNHPVFVFKPYPDYLVRGFSKAINNIGRHGYRYFTIESVNMKDSQAVSDFNGILKKSPETLIDQGVDSFVTLSISFSSQLGFEREEQKVRGKFAPLDSYTFSKWLESQERLKALTQRSDGQKTLFPYLRPVWDVIQNYSINSAIEVLNQKKYEGKKTMSVLGFKVLEDFVVLLAPLVILCVIALFLTHLVHIRSIVSRNIECLSEFPWILFFSGSLSRSLTYGSLLLLPVMANLIVIIRAWDMSSSSTWIGLVFAIGSLIISFKVLNEVEYLRKHIQCRSEVTDLASD